MPEGRDDQTHYPKLVSTDNTVTTYYRTDHTTITIYAGHTRRSEEHEYAY